MKKCSKCENTDIGLFSKNKSSSDGLRSVCKICSRKYGVSYYDTNKIELTNQHKEYRLDSKNKLKISSKNKIWYSNNADNVKKRTSVYAKSNRDMYRKYQRNYYANNKDNFSYIYGSRLRTRIWNALKGKARNKHMSELIGCSWEDLKIHLESLFQPSMTWNNYGEWHIDHIKPLSLFDLSNEEELSIACHYTNLQPLWAKDNLVKSNKYEEKYYV